MDVMDVEFYIIHLIQFWKFFYKLEIVIRYFNLKKKVKAEPTMEKPNLGGEALVRQSV